MPQKAFYATQATRDYADFIDVMVEQHTEGAPTEKLLDSVKNESGIQLPSTLATLVGEVGDDKQATRILDSVRTGMDAYKREHGVLPTADVVEAAVQQGLVAFRGLRNDGTILDAGQAASILDSASSVAADPMSLQPNRAVVSILTAIVEAIPFAGYLPVDIGSNEGRLAIVSHVAGSNFGDYSSGALFDGANIGGIYSSSSRMVSFNTSGAAPYTSAFTQANLTSNPGYCDPAGTGVPVLRGRTQIFVNGYYAGCDQANSTGNTSPISGSITIAGVQLAIAGTVNVTNGAITISSPTLTGYEVTAQAFIDFESAPALIPKVNVNATVYPIYANPSRVLAGVTIDAAGQFRNELGLDASSEALLAVRNQMAMERHYLALRKAWNLGANQTQAYNFNLSAQGVYKTRAMIAQDLASYLGEVDQKMANATMDHGVTHIYVPAFFAATLSSLPSELFEPSGITARPGIYRVGRLFGKYEIYYSPRVVSESTDLKTAQLLAVGRSNQPGRCPIILGDAVAPTYLDLNMVSDLVKNAAMYSRDFTATNPHQPSASAACRISVSGLDF
jgi:hypothetical protein